MIVDDFQKLLDSNKASFTDDELGLFLGSVRCFHAGIFRPAYILAYQYDKVGYILSKLVKLDVFKEEGTDKSTNYNVIDCNPIKDVY